MHFVLGIIYSEYQEKDAHEKVLVGLDQERGSRCSSKDGQVLQVRSGDVVRSEYALLFISDDLRERY